MTTACTYKSPFSDSGDRGADMAYHERFYHPDHTHVWGDSTYEWEQKGQPHIANGDRTTVTPRPVTVQRCTVTGCTVREDDDMSERCGR